MNSGPVEALWYSKETEESDKRVFEVFRADDVVEFVEGALGVYDENAPTAPKPCTMGHTYLDYTELSPAKTKQVAGKLRDKAEARGRQHP